MTHITPAVRILVLVLVLLGGLSIPGASHAYFTTNQEAIPVGGGALFTIEYAFGVGKHTLHMPIFTERGTERKNSTLSYEILDGEGNPGGGKAVGIVLSSAPVSGLEYVVSRGIKRHFTLLVAYAPEKPGEYRLQVTQLPFSFDGTQQLQLNPSELTYYATKLIPLE